MENHWLFQKHRANILTTGINISEFRRMISEEAGIPLASKNEFNYYFDWGKITPSFSAFYDFENCEKILKEFLLKSKLINSDKVLIETSSTLPIIELSTNYFIEFWDDFVFANGGLGSAVVSTKFDLIMEFTDDRKYFLFSNFKIFP